MKKSILLALAGMLFVFNTLATPTKYEWEKERAPYKLTDAEKAMSELILKQHQQYDYALENDQFVLYSTYHRIVYVNNDEAVQRNNRITISMYNTLELVELKARAFSKNGKVTNFNKSDLKEIKDEESGNAYRIFAIDGVEKGSEIEYYFTRKMTAPYYDRINSQSDTKIKKASFLLTCPNHLRFDFKSYNGAKEITREEIKEKGDSKEPNRYHLEMDEVPPLKSEPYAYFDAALMKVEFKLAYNTARSMARLYTWEEAGKSFYKVLYNREKEEEKAVDKFTKGLKDDPASNFADRISNVEDRIKSEIKIDLEQNDSPLKSLASICKTKIASKEGITRLFLAVYEKLGIICSPVITSNREKTRFDGKFDTWSYLDDYAIYFPDTKGFIAPYNYDMRYPLIPSTWTAQDALFIEPITVGDLKSALASVKEVPAPDYSLNKHNHKVDVTFSDDLRTSSIKMVQELAGYNASFIIPYFNVMTDDQKKELTEDLIKQTAPDKQIKTWRANLTKDKVTGLVVDVDFLSGHFLEKAGPRILFKIGLLIGPQTEMYRDDSRVNPIENDHNRAYERLIRVTIPAGYTIKNLGDLKLKVLYRDKEKVPFSFESDYSLKGNILEITVNEYYKEIYAPLNRYDDFRKVVNAAADFNKVTLVLEKTK
jgi:hypothetical protein